MALDDAIGAAICQVRRITSLLMQVVELDLFRVEGVETKAVVRGHCIDKNSLTKANLFVTRW